MSEYNKIRNFKTATLRNLFSGVNSVYYFKFIQEVTPLNISCSNISN